MIPKPDTRMRGYFCLSSLCCLFMICLWIAARPCTGADVLSYDTVVEQALNNSHDIRMSRLDIGISEASLKRAYSLYYPTIKAQWNTEYVRDLSDGTYQVTAVGNTVLVQNTMYQSSLLLAGNYNLFDFGATGKRVSIAESDVSVRKEAYLQAVRDIKLKVLEIYSGLLTSTRELETKRELLTLYKELALTKERLYKAGRISKVEMVDDAVKAIRIVDDIDMLKLKTTALLKDLSLYTGATYNGAFTIRDLAEPAGSQGVPFDVSNTPESRIYALEINKKESELDAMKNELYPRLGLYSNYIWYANHDNEYDTTARYIKPRNWFIGIAATVTLFEGFKSNAEIEKTKLEIDRLKVEKARKLAEVSGRYDKLTDAKGIYTQSTANQTDMLKKVEDKLAMVERLSRQKLIEWPDYLNQRIELLGARLDLTRAVIARISSMKQLELLSEAVR